MVVNNKHTQNKRMSLVVQAHLAYIIKECEVQVKSMEYTGRVVGVIRGQSMVRSFNLKKYLLFPARI